MKVRLTIVVLFFSSFSFGQTSYLKDAVDKLDKALIEKDTAILKQLLHENVTYGHSNGWVETKADVLQDLTSGKLVYHTIKPDSITWKTESDWASMRSKTRVEVSLNGNRMDLNLHILEVWLKTNKGWQLIARQSVKL
jgi:Domain of unknown function (DUF4440)